MIPTTWLSIVFFMLLIAPGLLFDLLSERRRVGASESAFREASRVVLASLAFNAVGLLLLAGIRAFVPTSLPDAMQLLSGGEQYVADHPWLMVRTFALQSLVALGAAFFAHWLLSRRTGTNIRAVSGWWKVLRNECPPGMVPHARVRLTNGTVYLGRVGHYTADLDLADRELILVPPLFSKTGESPLTAVPGEWQRIIVHGGAVETLSVQYRPTELPGGNANGSGANLVAGLRVNTDRPRV